eukprot:560384-Rhodomonas_salina.2
MRCPVLTEGMPRPDAVGVPFSPGSRGGVARRGRKGAAFFVSLDLLSGRSIVHILLRMQYMESSADSRYAATRNQALGTEMLLRGIGGGRIGRSLGPHVRREQAQGHVSVKAAGGSETD